MAVEETTTMDVQEDEEIRARMKRMVEDTERMEKEEQRRSRTPPPMPKSRALSPGTSRYLALINAKSELKNAALQRVISTRDNAQVQFDHRCISQ